MTGSYDCVDGRSPTRYIHAQGEKKRIKKNKRIKKEKSKRKRNSYFRSLRRGGDSCIDEEFHGGFFGEFWF